MSDENPDRRPGTDADPDSASDPADQTDSVVQSLERPDRRLAYYYLIASLVSGPFYPIVVIASLIRYKTLRYRFDEEGVSMRWGVLFRREVSLTYARIQDIHLASNAVERHLGLGKVLVQTASGSSGAEIKIEGFSEYELIRDYLYSRMRGAKGLASASARSHSEGTGETTGAEAGRSLAVVLEELAQELDALREALATREGPADVRKESMES